MFTELEFSILRIDHPHLAPRPDDLSGAMAQVEKVWSGPSAPGDHAAVESTRNDILAFCGEHDDALHRSCLGGHLTGSALVVDPDRRQTLLLHHTKLDRWLQPGGHADGDGNLAHVALREATEETGIEGLAVMIPAIDVDIHPIPARPGEPEHLHLDVRFLVLAPSGARVAHNHEALEARWVSGDDPLVTGGDLRRPVGRALALASALA